MTDMLAKAPVDRRIAAIVRPTVEGMGFRLVRVRLMGGKRITLQIMAERPDGSMEVEDCAELSRSLSVLLDVEDPIEREYSLEVSSPGIDRPLTRPEDFATYAGHEAKLETEAPIDGRRRFRGPILGVEGGDVRMRVAGLGDIALPFESLGDARLVLTDALIEESLRRGRGPRPDTEVDEIAFEQDEDAASDGAVREESR